MDFTCIFFGVLFTVAALPLPAERHTFTFLRGKTCRSLKKRR